MKMCNRYEDLLARFIHGELLLQEKEDLESHLAVCSSCERSYRDATDVDLALRGFPEKLVDPPPYLRARILANLPEPEAAAARGWGRWAAALGGALAAAALAFVVFRAEAPREERIASVPAPPRGEYVPAPAPPAEEARGEAAAPRGEPGEALPAPAAGPAAARTSPPSRVAEAPKVQIIREVRIFFYYPPAQKVAVTGDFNGWDPRGVPLSPAGKPGLWETNLRLKPGAYSYNFIVDGNILVPDPNALNQSPDGYGGTNSILLVKADSV